ncbi:MAG: acyltransferase, partial [Gammaproteobacteria bacterium]|nr:acyltransferase [Gammaproteobacteria bacterium]
MASGPNVNANLLEAERMIEEAAKQGAELVVLPENFAIMGVHETDKVEQREAPGEGPIQDFLFRQAKRHKLWLVGGTIPLQASVPDRIRAACLLINPEG